MRVWVDNRSIIDTASIGANSATHASNTGIEAFLSDANTARIKILEFHPRSMTMPTELQTLGSVIADWPALGTTTVIADTFTGSAGALEGTTTSTGSATWARTLSQNAAALKLNGSGKAHRDTSVAENAVILYTVPWSSTTFADVSVDSTPPGTVYGAGDNARGGVLCWQDANNWLGARLYVDDSQVDSAEIEIYYVYNGAAADVLRRVNFGTEINHGVTSTIRLVTDGDKFVCYLGTEPVFTWKISWTHASHAAWSINKVGLFCATNDNGSTFDSFVAKSA